VQAARANGGAVRLFLALRGNRSRLISRTDAGGRCAGTRGCDADFDPRSFKRSRERIVRGWRHRFGRSTKDGLHDERTRGVRSSRCVCWKLSVSAETARATKNTGSILLKFSLKIPERIDAVITTENFAEAWRLSVRTAGDKNFIKLRGSYLVSCRTRKLFLI